MYRIWEAITPPNHDANAKCPISEDNQKDGTPAPDDKFDSRADPDVRTPTILSLPTPAITSVSDTDTEHNDSLPSLPPDDEPTEDYVPDPDMEESLFSTDFPTPPTLDAYFSLSYDSGQYYPVRAGARFPPPPTLDEYDDPSIFRDHNHLDCHRPLKHVRN